MKLSAQTLLENCNGTDLSPRIMEECASGGYSVFLLGGKPDVAAQAAECLTARWLALKVAGEHEGFFADEDAVVARINASGADVLFVDMGAPRQEKLIVRNRARLTPRMCLGVGALNILKKAVAINAIPLTQYTNVIPRAPQWMIV